MTDLREPNSSVLPATGSANGGADDPLHSLYRMSRTAGLGSGDYVAINNTAILSLLLGLASVLSLLYPFMLLLALAAAVCGVIALVQIHSSNGTQSGRGFAALGILLALSLGGVAGGKVVVAGIEQRRDKGRIGEVVNRLSDLIVAKEYSKAYQTLFSENFKKDFSEQEFANKWESFVPFLGDVKKIGWGERAEFETIRATDSKRAFVQSTIQFGKSQQPGLQPMSFVLADGEWMIESIGQLFEKPKDGKRVEMPDPTQPQGPEFPIPGGLPGQ
jgi:hypothetical protein